MLIVNIPEALTNTIQKFAKQACQTPEEYVVELIEERIAHESAYNETAYLSKSAVNRDRLDEAIEDIRGGKYESHGLINENN
jgi:hypothetical protein